MDWVNPNFACYLHDYARYTGGHVPSHVKSLLYLNFSLNHNEIFLAERNI
ncbi:hypothetical protein Hanom_Chr05g00454941 [Helianthus anomalus]